MGCHLHGEGHSKDHGTVIAVRFCDYLIERQSGMVKTFCINLTLLVFIFSVQTVLSEPTKIYTIQVMTNNEKNNALREAKKLAAEKVNDVSVEKIGAQYTVRIGKYSEQIDGSANLEKIRQVYPESVLRKVYDMPNRLIYRANTSVLKSTEYKPAVEKAAGKSTNLQSVVEKSKLDERHSIDYQAAKPKVTPPAVSVIRRTNAVMVGEILV